MRNFLLSLAFIFVSITFSFAQNKIVLTVNNVSVSYGDIMVALYNSESSFLNTPFKVNKTSSSSNIVTLTFENIPNGYYAISLYQDEDKNEELTRGMFGPKEPYAFSNNAKGSYGPAEFDDAKFEVKDEDLVLEIDID